MALRFYNTLTQQVEPFAPLQGNTVRMYTCGPTVWNFAHVGNLRAFLFYDLVRRHLQVSGYRMTHVMNLTDIDDRILDQAMHAGTTIGEYVKPYVAAFFEDMSSLRAQLAEHFPRATEHIPEMVEMIAKLIEEDHATVGDFQAPIVRMAFGATLLGRCADRHQSNKQTVSEPTGTPQKCP